MKVTVFNPVVPTVKKGDIIEFKNSRNANGKKSYYIITYLEKEKKYYLASMRGSQRKITLYDSIEEMLEGKSGYSVYSGKHAHLTLNLWGED